MHPWSGFWLGCRSGKFLSECAGGFLIRAELKMG